VVFSLDRIQNTLKKLVDIHSVFAACTFVQRSY